MKPVIAITMGDPAGIGPEIAVKALQKAKIYDVCKPIVIGDAQVIEQAAQFSGQALVVRPVEHIDEGIYTKGTIDVLDLQNAPSGGIKTGKISAQAGRAAFEAVKKAIELAISGSLDATVTGPIHKAALQMAGFNFSGHTEIYAHFTNTKKYAMLLVQNGFRVIHVSTHVSLRQACELVRTKRILEVIQLMHAACIQFGIAQPRIGVAGLNPHAGDEGLFGTEERDEIIPAVQAAQKQGIMAEGPVPADTLFSKARGGVYDGCVAMYHDQGHIPFKMEGFNWDPQKNKMESVSGVNITLGLPIIRTSVDHGTAMDIAGKGIASPDALIMAIEYAVQMAINRVHG